MLPVWVACLPVLFRDDGLFELRQAAYLRRLQVGTGKEGAVKLTDPRFKYTPSLRTNVQDTWRRFGWKPMTEIERQARRAKPVPVPQWDANRIKKLQLNTSSEKD